ADAALRSEVRARLEAAPDLARSLARLVVGRGGARDLPAIRGGIAAAASPADTPAPKGEGPGETTETMTALRRPRLGNPRGRAAALADELPLIKRDGSFVRAGYDGALDEARGLRDDTRRVIAALQTRYAELTGVRTLKVKYNNQIGYFVEVPAQHAEKLRQPPLSATFIHRMTMAGQVRFSSTELGALEAKIASAADRALGIELATFDLLSA